MGWLESSTPWKSLHPNNSVALGTKDFSSARNTRCYPLKPGQSKIGSRWPPHRETLRISILRSTASFPPMISFASGSMTSVQLQQSGQAIPLELKRLRRARRREWPPRRFSLSWESDSQPLGAMSTSQSLSRQADQLVVEDERLVRLAMAAMMDDAHQPHSTRTSGRP